MSNGATASGYGLEVLRPVLSTVNLEEFDVRTCACVRLVPSAASRVPRPVLCALLLGMCESLPGLETDTSEFVLA